MEPLNIKDFETKRDGAKKSVPNQNKKTETSTSTKSHRDIVLNNCNMMMKWAYDNK